MANPYGLSDEAWDALQKRQERFRQRKEAGELAAGVVIGRDEPPQHAPDSPYAPPDLPQPQQKEDPDTGIVGGFIQAAMQTAAAAQLGVIEPGAAEQPPVGSHQGMWQEEEPPPAYIQEPVPENWGDWAKWWLNRQVQQVGDWWDSAQEVIAEAGPEEGEGAFSWASEWWDDFTNRVKEQRTTKEEVEAAVAAGQYPIWGTKRAAEVTLPAPPIKKTGLGMGEMWAATEQATRGVTGALGQAAQVPERLLTQVLGGAANELLTPLLEGQEKISFTPAELEAHRTHWSWFGQATKARARKIKEGVETGQSLEDMMRAGDEEAIRIFDSMHDEAVRRIEEGESPDEVEAALYDPASEFIGRLIFDPLNLLGAGNKLRMTFDQRKYMKLMGTASDLKYDEVAVLMRELGEKRGIVSKIHPFGKLNTTRANQWIENSVDVIGRIAAESVDDVQFGRAMTAMIAAAGEDGPEARAAYQWLAQNYGAMPHSKLGKEAAIFLRESVLDEAGQIDFKFMESILGEQDSEAAILRLMEKQSEVTARYFPAEKTNKIKDLQNHYRRWLSQYMYMGFNPGYAVRNATSNTVGQLANGINPLMGADARTDFLQRFGFPGTGARRAIGGPSLQAAVEAGEAISPFSLEGTKWADVLKAGPEDFWAKKLKSAPAIAMANQAEVVAAENIVVQTLDQYMRRYWKPQVPAELAQALGPEHATALQRLAQNALSEAELRLALDQFANWSVLPEVAWDELLKAPRGLMDEISAIQYEVAEMGGGRAEFVRRLEELKNNSNLWLDGQRGQAVTELPLGTIEAEAARAEWQMLSRLDDTELFDLIYSSIRPDQFELQLTLDRARSEALMDAIRQRMPGNTDLTDAYLKIEAKYQPMGGEIAQAVDASRQQAHTIVDGLRIQAEKGDITWPEFRTRAKQIWDNHAAQRNDLWRGFWDGRNTDVNAALGGNMQLLDFSDIDPEIAAMIEQRQQVALSMLKETRPGALQMAESQVTQTNYLIDQIIASVGDDAFAAGAPITAEAYNAVAAWLDELRPQMVTTKGVGTKVATEARDFILYNYSDRRNIDAVLSYIYPYHFWYTRALPGWAKTAIMNPSVISAFNDYRQFRKDINAEVEGLPWWEQQVKVPGLDMYFNLEATFNPMYSAMNDFHDPERTATGTGELLENMGSWGPTIDTAFWAMYAMWRAAEGKPDEALASFGYLGTPTKAFRYGTALAVGKPITLEPWMWEGVYERTAVKPFVSKGDKWDRQKMGLTAPVMVAEGEFTNEQIYDSLYRAGHGGWDENVEKLVARVAQDRAPQVLTSWLLGAGFKGRRAEEVEIQRAMNSKYELGQYVHNNLDLETEEGRQQMKDLYSEFYETYPFMPLLELARAGELDRDSAYAWNVLGRLPPGTIRREILDKAGLQDELISKFYSDKGSLASWSNADREHFMASVEAIGGALKIPEQDRKKEWRRAIQLNSDLRKQLQADHGIDIWDIQETYFEIKEELGEDAAKVFLQANPKLVEMWSAKADVVTQNPALFAYYSSIDALDRVGRNLVEEETEARWPGYRQAMTEYNAFDKATRSGRRRRKEFLKENPWLKDVWNWKEEIEPLLDNIVIDVADGMPVPLGPTVREDTQWESVLTDEITKMLKSKFQSGDIVRTRVGALPEEPEMVKPGAGLPEWVPPGYQGLILQAAEQYPDVPEMAQYLSALLRQESQFDPQAVSPVGAQGIAQFMPKTAEAWQVDPFDPQSAIPGAAAYLAKYYRYFDGDWVKTLASYNAGPGRAMDGSWTQIDETQLYVKNITQWVREMQESEGVPRTVQGQYPGASLRADQQAIEEARYEQNLNALFDAWYDLKKADREAITEQYRDFFGESDPDDEDVVNWWASHQGNDWRKEVIQKYIADLDTSQMSDYEKIAILENQFGIPSGEYLSFTAQERLSYWRGEKALPEVVAEVKAQLPSKTGRARKAVSKAAKAVRVTGDTLSWPAVYDYLGQDVFGLIQHFNTGKPMNSELMSSLQELFGEASLGYTEFDDWLSFVRLLWRASAVKSFRGRNIGVAKRIKPPTGSTRAGRRFTPWG